MELNYKIEFLFTTFFFLVCTEVNTLKCFQCTNCTVSNSKVVTCSIPSSTNSTTTAPTTITSTTLQSSTVNSSVSSNVTTTTTIPTSTASTTTSVSTSTTSVSSNNSIVSNITNFQVLRPIGSVKSKFDVEELLYTGCDCKNELCDCETPATIRQVAQTNFVCVTAASTVNNISMVNKGCAVDMGNSTSTCMLSGYGDNCKICSADLCNISSKLKTSLIVLLTALYTSTFRL